MYIEIEAFDVYVSILSGWYVTGLLQGESTFLNDSANNVKKPPYISG